MRERLTDDARKAIALAREEARSLHGIGPEHLLLGLLHQQNAFASRALYSLGITLEDLRGQVVGGRIENSYTDQHEDKKMRAESRLREDWREEPASTQRPNDVLELALKEAEISGRYYIGTVHLLRALLQQPEGVAVRVLSNLGVGTLDVRRRVMQMLRGGEYQEKKRGGLHNFEGKGRRGPMGTSIRLELLDDDRFARELSELLILTGIVAMPDENSSPPGLPSGERNEPPGASLEAKLAARVERAVEELGSHIEMMRDDLLGLERARRKLSELIDDTEQGSRSTDE